jgi:TraM recognition site of TraD and TraG
MLSLLQALLPGPLGGFGALVIVATLLIGAAFAIRSAVPWLWKLLVRLVNLIPAAILAAMGVCAIVFWRIVSWLVTRTLARLPLDAAVAGAIDRLARLRTSWIHNPIQLLLVRGQRQAAAQALWPESVYPDLYREVPRDVARPPYDDGRLLGGMRFTWLADRHMTEASVRSAVNVALTMAGIAFILLLLVHLHSIYAVVRQSSTALGGGGMPAEQWPGAAPARIPGWWVFTATFAVVFSTFARGLGDLLTYLPGTAVACLGLALLMLLHQWHRQKSAPYEWQSKDADVRWAFRSETRNLARTTYREQVLQATEYLKDAPCFLVGHASGILRARGDLSAPASAQPMSLDREALFQHLLVFGGTGEGKTTALLKPLMRQILRQPAYGLYVCDAKGVLWHDAAAIAHEERPGAELIVLGTGQGQSGVDLLAGLTPTQVAATLRSVLAQLSGGHNGDSFWPDMAANVLRNVLSVARAYAYTEHGRGAFRRIGAAPYSLWWAYQAVLQADLLNEAVEQLRQWATQANEAVNSRPAAEVEALRRLYPIMTSREVLDSVRYLEGTWQSMAKDTRSGIVANVTQLLDGFAGAAALRERFACGNPAQAVAVSEALNGRIVLNALSSVEDGLPARLVSVLLKTHLYREARRREAAHRQGAGKGRPQDQPCIVIMDEVQEIVTADVTSGLSDATFWNVARSTGVAGIFATQTVAGLYQAIGREAATNFMQQARSKVFFRTEDRETVEYACWCAGRFERNRVYDDGHRESVEYRMLIDGWDPLAAVDESEVIKGGARQFFHAARALLSPERMALGQAEAARAYTAEAPAEGGVGRGEMGATQFQLALIQAQRQAQWRAEDLERDYRKSGNEVAEALTPADLVHMGRWHTFAQIQRAGAVRQDIMAVKHDFG